MASSGLPPTRLPGAYGRKMGGGRPRKAVPLAALLIASCWTTPARTSSVELWRLDCGHFELRNINGRPRTVSNGRYLLRHGRDYMLWDAGLEEKLVGRPRVSESQALNLSRTLPTQFAEIGVQPERIGRIGVSYHHGDHLGQAARFPQATLLIGRKDWAEIRTNAAEASLMRP